MDQEDDLKLNELLQRDAALRERLELSDERVEESLVKVSRSLVNVIAALRTGRVSPAQRAEIRSAVERLPRDRFTAERAAIEQLLDR